MPCSLQNLFLSCSNCYDDVATSSWCSGMGKEGRDLQHGEVWYLGCGTITGKQARASSRQRVGWSSNGWAQYLRCCTENRNLTITLWKVSFFAPLLIETALSFVLNKTAPALRFFYLVCGPELCVCATRIGVTSRLFPLWEKTDFVPAWLILLTACTTHSFYRFVILSLRSLHLCCTKPTPPTKHCTRRNNYFNKGEGFPHPRGNHQKYFFLLLPVNNTKPTKLRHIIWKYRISI